MKSELNSKIATEVGKICIPDASAIVKKHRLSLCSKYQKETNDIEGTHEKNRKQLK